MWADEGSGVLTAGYRNAAFFRGLRIRAAAPAPAVYANGRISFAIALAPGESWCGSLLYDLMDGDTSYAAPTECLMKEGSPQSRDLQAWRSGIMKLESSIHAFERLFDQAVEDMAALRLPIPGDSGTVFIPAAGLPWFVALFGRDPLIVSLQTMILSPDFARGTLKVLGAWQEQNWPQTPMVSPSNATEFTAISDALKDVRVGASTPQQAVTKMTDTTERDLRKFR